MAEKGLELTLQPNMKLKLTLRRRILLHRALESSLENRMKMIGIFKPAAPILLAKRSDGLKDLEILKDEMGNYTIRFKDNEGNILVDSLDFFQPFDSEVQNELGAKPFSGLSEHIRTKIIHGLEFRLLQKKIATPETPESVPPITVRKHESNITTISEYLSQGELEFPNRNGNMEEHVDLTDSVGERKKPTAVSIERLLYPQRFTRPKLVETELARTEIVLRKSSKPLPYTKSFPELHLSPQPVSFKHHLMFK